MSVDASSSTGPSSTGPSSTARRLVMVYDAPPGLGAAIADSLQKAVGRGCPLCAITHGLFGKRQATRDLEAELSDDCPIDERHLGELVDLEDRLGKPVPTPSVLVEIDDGTLAVLLDAAAIDCLRRGGGPFRAALRHALTARRIASPLD